jgi:6-phosphogluconolactonase
LKRDRLRIIVEESREALSERGARLFEKGAIEAVVKEGHFSVALSGGSTPREMHKRLASRSSIPWQEVHIFWGDERCVPAGDPSSNYGAAWVDFLGKVPLPAERIHPMPAYMTPEQGALSYERELEHIFNLKQGHLPFFDLVFLGLGKDGHTASLFPGQESLEERERFVVAVKGGDPDVYRLTLTFPVLNRAGEVIFMVSGKEKAGVVKAVIEAEDERFPASRVRPASGMLTWLLDREAASLLGEKTLSSFS